ncbi:TraB/GumN family protein [Marinomonas agarivorans]|nr:TraB/GumN family protein [Marinomonas agarivorans]
MLRPLFYFFLFYLLSIKSIYVHADQQQVISNEPQAFMWRVKNGYSTLYLVGSIHALHEKYYPLASAYQAAFEASHKLVVELNIDAIDPTYMQALLRQKMWLPEGHTLENYLNQSELSLLEKYSVQINTPYKTLIKMRPWIVTEMLTVLQLRQANFDPQKGVDRHFLSLAKENNMPILELETAEEQITALADSPFDSQIGALSLTIQQLNDTSYLPKLVALWEQGNHEALYKLVYQGINEEERTRIQPMMKRLLSDRNVKMTDVLSIYLATRHTYFVVVGALHLSGPDSILKLLEQKGYQVEQIK